MDLDRAVYLLAVALITAGVVILADVGATLLWKEPTSSIYASVRQHDASSALDDLEGDFPSPADRRAVRDVHGKLRKVRILARLFATRVSDGDPIGRIVIPTIGLDIVVVQATSTGDLTKGPGHYPQTPFPGQPGTSAIAGHRTTYLAPFRHLDRSTAATAWSSGCRTRPSITGSSARGSSARRTSESCARPATSAWC